MTTRAALAAHFCEILDVEPSNPGNVDQDLVIEGVRVHVRGWHASPLRRDDVGILATVEGVGSLKKVAYSCHDPGKVGHLAKLVALRVAKVCAEQAAERVAGDASAGLAQKTAEAEREIESLLQRKGYSAAQFTCDSSGRVYDVRLKGDDARAFIDYLRSL